MGRLEDMAMFIRIVESGGISKASEQLDIAKSAVSRRLQELEKRLGVQLLNRTTRKVALTDAGDQYYKQAKHLIEQANEIDEQVQGNKTLAAGVLRLTAPLSFGLLHLTDVLDEFIKQYPDLKLEIDFSDRQVDLIEEGFELAFRIGQLPDSSFQAKKVATSKHVICASDEYLARAGTPAIPQDLIEHDFLSYGLHQIPNISLTDKNNQLHQVAVNSKIRTNNGDFLKTMACNGHGLTYIPTFIAFDAIRSGDLIVVLADYQLAEFGVYALYPKNRFLPQRYRLLIDFIDEYFSRHMI